MLDAYFSSWYLRHLYTVLFHLGIDFVDPKPAKENGFTLAMKIYLYQAVDHFSSSLINSYHAWEN